METRAHYILIGSVVLSVIAAAFIFVLWISQTQREFDTYDVIFNERVSGLSIGSIVRFNGIQKGEVEDLSIDPEDPAIVIARVRVEKDTPIKTDTTAELEFVGFTGLALVQFVGGSPSAPLLKEASDERVPKVVADMSGFNLILQNSGDMIAQANRLLSEDNIQAVAAILANLETTTAAIADNSDEISSLIVNANRATDDLSLLIADLRAASEGLSRLLNEDAPGAIENADALIAETRALMADLRGVVNDNRDAFDVFAEQGLGQVAPALAEARRLMRTLDYMLREIERDPKNFLLGDPTPRYNAEAE